MKWGGQPPHIFYGGYMAFTQTVIDRWQSDGKMYEKGTWLMDTGTTTGTITPEQNGHGWSAGIVEIYFTDFDSDGTNPIGFAYSLGKGSVIISSVANDSGHYIMNGYCA